MFKLAPFSIRTAFFAPKVLALLCPILFFPLNVYGNDLFITMGKLALRPIWTGSVFREVFAHFGFVLAEVGLDLLVGDFFCFKGRIGRKRIFFVLKILSVGRK